MCFGANQVNWLDDAVGDVTTLLTRKKMYSDALVVFSSEYDTYYI